MKSNTPLGEFEGAAGVFGGDDFALVFGVNLGVDLGGLN